VKTVHRSFSRQVIPVPVLPGRCERRYGIRFRVADGVSKEILMNVPTEEALLAAMRSAAPAAGQAALWWLGQHSFVLRLGTATVYIDPYLTDNPRRRVRPLLAAAAVTNADLIIGTHDHSDHIDRPAWPILAQASPKAVFVVPELVRTQLIADLGLPAERVRGLDDGGMLELCGLRLHGLPAAHELLEPDPITGGFRFLGVVIEAEGCAIYHAGDSCIYEGMQARLRAFRLAAALLPINGRDAERLARNCIGNMTFQEAADLAGAIRPGLTVCAHFDMFMGNLEDPRKFADYMRVKYPDLAALIPEYGTRIDVPPAPGHGAIVHGRA
jgi:L-ascorbate metabolism protein UlaG (beta-lactamase superfamily)